MKIVNSISKIYTDLHPYAEKLRTQVDLLVRSRKKDNWHYYSRIKSLESFALKLETGRVLAPKEMEDYFACTLVVENINEIKKGIDFIDSLFEVKNRRPKTDEFTHKDSSSFAFDDLRLYVSLKKMAYMPPGILPDIIFEIQIKTFLQHAWSIATHDLIYKSDTVSWSKERVAYQIKAMLEQAEISISGANDLAKLPEIAKDNHETKALNEIMKFLVESFIPDSLPFDMLRLSQIINNVLKIFKLNIAKLKLILDAETALNRGAKTLDLSPYGIIIQSIINQEPQVFENVFKNGSGLKSYILIPSEISLNKITIDDGSKLVRI